MIADENLFDLADSITAQADAERKALSTLQARFALAGGYVFRQLSDGSFICSRWGMTRELSTIEDAERFFVLVTGKRK